MHTCITPKAAVSNVAGTKPVTGQEKKMVLQSSGIGPPDPVKVWARRIGESTIIDNRKVERMGAK